MSSNVFIRAYNIAMEKIATDSEDAEREKKARAKYLKDLKDKSLNDIDPEVVENAYIRKGLANLAGLGSLVGLGYGAAKKSKKILGLSGVTGALGLVGNNFEDRHVHRYTNDPVYRRSMNLGRRYMDSGTDADNDALTALITDPSNGGI